MRGSDVTHVEFLAACGSGGCVEVGRLADGGVAVRDSKDPQGPVLIFNDAEWRVFMAGVADGTFDGI